MLTPTGEPDLPHLSVPALLRPLCDGQASLELPGSTVREVLETLVQRYPAVGPRLFEGDRLKPALSVAVDGEVQAHPLSHRLSQTSQVSIIPAMAGGAVLT